MNPPIIIGSVLIAFGLAVIIWTARTNGEPAWYLFGLLFGEWGSMFVVRAMAEPGLPQTGVAIFFSIAMLSTGVMWWKARQRTRIGPPRV